MPWLRGGFVGRGGDLIAPGKGRGRGERPRATSGLDGRAPLGRCNDDITGRGVRSIIRG